LGIYGKTITGLTINASGSYRQGLFGYIGTGGEVKSIGLVNCFAIGEISGGNYTGGIAGSSNNTIQSCVALNPVITNE